jgi:hypothetical protein
MTVIQGFSQIKQLDVLFDKDGYPVNPSTREVLADLTYIQLYINSDFPKHGEGIDSGGVYGFESTIGFSMGYGYLYRWREQLGKMIGYPAKPTDHGDSYMEGAYQAGAGPFYELIWFTDNNGVINTAFCQKLLKDFEEWNERAKALGDEKFYSGYECFLAVFQKAADNGVVNYQ